MRVIFIICFLFLSSQSSFAQKAKKGKNPSPIILSLNAYSFNDLLMARDKRDNQQLYTFFNLLDWCKSQNIEALDATGYFFPTYPKVPSDEYIYKLKNRAKELGITISGTGIRNDFASPDPAVRAAGVALAKEWILVAEKLDAPVLRLFAGEIPKGYENRWDEVAGWMIESYKECAAFAEKHGVIIGIQNHGDMLQTAEQCIKVIKGVNSKAAGIIVDTGNFKTENPYADIEAMVPYAVNWQIKESAFGIGNPIETDYVKIMEILKRQNYKGFLPIETILVRGVPYDPFELVPAMFDKLRSAQKKVFKN
ncbi:sugar phosphate isomerase/epimerase family protein [Pedobacter cryophilus]|uniref:Sugar phosphate isomerase/epimerase n=1 Tax=Pedobacter cryophilus TaxID=2571271 RepID=A0A4U1BWE0_9SPHI|nr:sugar phosphate isomerase/epimerase family protein [Pedobacter cryophilus]TKB96918.1 sugar phosphate isomerase/epimerase [Pedobacter cryophilus]